MDEDSPFTTEAVNIYSWDGSKDTDARRVMVPPITRIDEHVWDIENIVRSVIRGVGFTNNKAEQINFECMLCDGKFTAGAEVVDNYAIEHVRNEHLMSDRRGDIIPVPLPANQHYSAKHLEDGLFVGCCLRCDPRQFVANNDPLALGKQLVDHERQMHRATTTRDHVDSLVKDDPRNVGHGHVHSRPDGKRKNCGGPAVCEHCALEIQNLSVGDKTRRASFVQHEATVFVVKAEYISHAEEQVNYLKDKMPSVYRNLVVGPIIGVQWYATFVFVPTGETLGNENYKLLEGFRDEFKQIFTSLHNGKEVMGVSAKWPLGWDDGRTAVKWMMGQEK